MVRGRGKRTRRFQLGFVCGASYGLSSIRTFYPSARRRTARETPGRGPLGLRTQIKNARVPGLRPLGRTPPWAIEFGAFSPYGSVASQR
jgi:hypothetical protein